MMTANSKLVKEIKNIIASTTKARTITQQEIDKVDAKYAALAEKEKKDLNKLLEIQNAQIAAYSKMIEADESVEQETPEEKPEETIQDTIFPDNNEEETVEETVEAEETEVETESETEELPATPETIEVKDETSSEELDWGDGNGDDDKEDDDEWPSIPEEW